MRVEAGGAVAIADQLERRPAAWRDPEWIVRAFQVADGAAGRERAGDDRLRRHPDGLGFGEPGRPVWIEAHRRSPVDDDDDVRRFVGEALTDDELVVAPRRREPRARPPVDRRDRVAGDVRARSGEVASAPPPGAPGRAERQAAQPVPGDERERSTGGRHGSSSRTRPSPDAAAARARGTGREAAPTRRSASAPASR